MHRALQLRRCSWIDEAKSRERKLPVVQPVVQRAGDHWQLVMSINTSWCRIALCHKVGRRPPAIHKPQARGQDTFEGLRLLSLTISLSINPRVAPAKAAEKLNVLEGEAFPRPAVECFLPHCNKRTSEDYGASRRVRDILSLHGSRRRTPRALMMTGVG